MKQWICLALLCLVYSFSAKSQPIVDSIKANQSYTVIDSILIRTSDGAFISAWAVMRRDLTEPQATILQFTIYARQTDILKMKDAADHGYIGVMAYSRGKRYSPGDATPYEHDGKDVYDVIEWIVQQNWSNQQVGMCGGSYNGFTQWAATKHLHPALKTIVTSASVAPGLDVPMTNNVSMSFVFPWIFYVTNNKFLDEADYRGEHWQNAYEEWFQRGSSYRSLDNIAGRPGNSVFLRWLDHPAYDQYWQAMIPYKEEFTNINIPVLSTTGYYDGGQIGELYYYREHLKYNPDAQHYLLIGPYGHFGSQGYPDSIYNGYKTDPAARVVIHDIIYEWFDHIFKGKPRPSILKDRVNYQVMDANIWKHTPTLDKMYNHELRLYLQPGSKDQYVLSEKPDRKKSFEQKIDFKDRRIRHSYYYFNRIVYRDLFANNGIVLVSDTINADLELAGNFRGEMKAIVNKKDMDFSLALFELRPDSSYFLLSYFMGRASYAKNKLKRKLLRPGKKESIPFSNSYMVCKKISKGSRLVLILNINKSPFEQINYGTGKSVSEETIADAREPLLIKWLGDSFINLPVGK